MSLNLIMATAGKDMLGLTFITEEQQAYSRLRTGILPPKGGKIFTCTLPARQPHQRLAGINPSELGMTTLGKES